MKGRSSVGILGAIAFEDPENHGKLFSFLNVSRSQGRAPSPGSVAGTTHGIT